jgi:hypothetical protein
VLPCLFFRIATSVAKCPICGTVPLIQHCVVLLLALFWVIPWWQAPGYRLGESIQHSEHGESLKSIIVLSCYSTAPLVQHCCPVYVTVPLAQQCAIVSLYHHFLYLHSAVLFVCSTVPLVQQCGIFLSVLSF